MGTLSTLLRQVDRPAPRQHPHPCESLWLLPSERCEDDIHVHRSSTLAVVQRLGARDTLTKKRATAVDLLAANGIKWWTPHDLRRTLTKVLDAAGIPGGSSVVLAHEVRRIDRLDAENDDSREQRVARITRLAYGGAQHLHLRRKAMSIWTDALLDKFAQFKSEWQPVETRLLR